jgi:hypothetical protein
MCFSASVSFSAGAALCATGVFAVAKSPKRELIPLAMFPLLFGIQQLCEGILWLTMNDKIPGSWTYPTAFTFLFFAQVLWPIWTPMAMIPMETNAMRKKILWGLLTTGALLSVYHTWCLFTFPVAVDVCGRHIDYVRYLPQAPAPYVAVAYIMVTVLPAFLSSSRNIRILGVAELLSFLLAAYLFREYVISVWCLFAAVISAFIVYIVLQWNKEIQPSTGKADVTKAHPH